MKPLFFFLLIFLAYISPAQRTFRDCTTCPEMVVIPAGEFLMGSTEKEIGQTRYTYFQKIFERPQHKVNIKSFACGKFDITKKDWAIFVKETNRSNEGACAWGGLKEDSAHPWLLSTSANWNHVGFAQDSSHPAICLTWDDTQDYLKWLSKKTGQKYRLLSESEWEYAARANTTTAFWWGDSASHEYANYGTDTIAGEGRAFGRDKWVATSPVDAFPPNPFGLYDMHGNVLQWVQDCFSDTYENAPTDGSAVISSDTLQLAEDLWPGLKGKKSSDLRMCRGGDFGDDPPLIRSAARNMGDVTGEKSKKYSSAGVGFRVARSL